MGRDLEVGGHRSEQRSRDTLTSIQRNVRATCLGLGPALPRCYPAGGDLRGRTCSSKHDAEGPGRPLALVVCAALLPVFYCSPLCMLPNQTRLHCTVFKTFVTAAQGLRDTAAEGLRWSGKVFNACILQICNVVQDLLDYSELRIRTG